MSAVLTCCLACSIRSSARAEVARTATVTTVTMVVARIASLLEDVQGAVPIESMIDRRRGGLGGRTSRPVRPGVGPGVRGRRDFGRRHDRGRWRYGERRQRRGERIIGGKGRDLPDGNIAWLGELQQHRAIAAREA